MEPVLPCSTEQLKGWAQLEWGTGFLSVSGVTGDKPGLYYYGNQAGGLYSVESGERVHFEGGTVAQIVYSDDQTDRQQQVVYTADGSSYTSVESAEHTLVYIHPADGTQTVFADQPQVAYIQQDGATQQVVLLPSGQNMNAANLHVLSNVAEAPQALLEPVPQEQLSNQLTSITDIAEPPSSPLGATDSTDDSDEDEEDDSEMDDWEPPSQHEDFNPHKLWCEECNGANPSVCLKHGPLHPVPNRPVLSKARASLPQILYIDRFLGGVFSKRRIPKRTQFGPLEAPLISQRKLQDSYIHLKLCLLDSEKEAEKSSDMWFDLSEEDSCNWMMFVRPAQNHLEQNLVAYQYGPEIFFTTIKNIQPKQELKEMLELTEKQDNEEEFEGVQNGLKAAELETEPGTEAEGELPAAVEASVPESASPPSNLELPLVLKEDPSQNSESDAHLTSQDMRRAKRIRNAALQHLFIRKSFRPFKCTHCGKAFRDKDKLDQHLRVHGREAYTFSCHICTKSFMTDSALEDHLLVHTENRSYTCLLCPEIFEKLDLLKDHVGVHAVDGCFTCPSCKKTFNDFIQLKKHIRCFHSEKVFQCPDCEKAFCRPDKLRLHMLRHSDRKDFLCSTCGKQFKRKDKLREHMQRMHNPDREAKKADKIHRSKALKMKVPTTDFESFMFKCRLCMMGFRRRGMLVNHLSKRHPEMRIDDVPELTLPIIKPNRDYFYLQSASKRKAHILKNHPGAELPPSIRKLRPAAPGEPDPMLSTHTQLTGTIATAPVCCPHCAKQYSSKTKMVQHIRKKHPEFAQLASTIQAPLTTAVISSTPAVISTDGTTAEAVVTTDLLTQAMTELSQTLTTDYRTAQGRLPKNPASSPHSQHQAVDVSQLHDPHSYSQHSIQVQHIQVTEPTGNGPATQVAGQPLSPSSQQTSQELSPSQLTPVTLAQSQSLSTSNAQPQQQGAVQHAYLPGNWNYRGYSSEIQMMALPHAQYVIAEASTPVSGVNSSQVKTTHYVISEGQAELDTKQTVPQTTAQSHTEHLEQQSTNQQATTQYIITTTTNGSGASEVHITKP
ncbi:hypothetical protein NQD34_009389 [Periophthalmus magnuspinnatus]|nr:hypothetical protein NQD34_009389 [Periophthalmus magnuspinnatus]